MTNLPITASTPQAAAPGKKSSVGAEAADAQNSQPFGEVLARQISTPALNGAKADDQLALELAAQTVAEVADIGKDDKTAATVSPGVRPDPTGDLPTDLLAALLPQVLNTAAGTAPATAGTKSDTPATGPAERGAIATRKPDVAAGIQAAATTQTEQPAAAEPGGTERAFVAALIQAGNQTAARQEPGVTPREANVAAAITTATAAAVSAVTQQASTPALAAMQNTVAGIAATVMQAAPLTVSTPVNQPRWGDEFSQKITWLASSKVDQSAELHLNPPQLGPLDVVLKVSGDQATALFTSPHAAVREAIEQALPKLRDMLSDNGITLGNTTVSDQTPRDQSKPDAQRTPENANDNLRDAPATGANASRVSPISRHNGIVDTFA